MVKKLRCKDGDKTITIFAVENTDNTIAGGTGWFIRYDGAEGTNGDYFVPSIITTPP